MTRAHRGAGFTLIELVVALTLTGFAALLAARTLVAVSHGAASARDAREALDRRVNGSRWLERALRSLDMDGPAGRFSGVHDRLDFATWVERPEGWLERERIALVVEGTALVARHSGEDIVLALGVDSLAVDYLLLPGEDSRWVRTWESAVSAPLAVRLRIAAGGRVDTLLCLVGERG